ncbi:hypothetical protein BCR44DRAFT_1439951 [Catenaria anguillulae PL171]|uniref:Uncharacterized protein n=1 Tax=Catenaria anguillulae PL171 TaxID=765915 RepID=A0A1Y2HDL8_9FUNG|nr:hypothetical protein BCR44DRAFT_1439951 [Catenaria anguillulae PL171]
MLANLADSVAGEFSRALIEQSHLRATYAQWAAIPDTDPFWSQPDVLIHFSSPTSSHDPARDVFSVPPSVAAGPPAHPQDLFATVRPGHADGGSDNQVDEEEEEELASLFSFLPVPSSVSPTQDAACLDPSELHADEEEPPLDFDTLEELLGIASSRGPNETPGRGTRLPPMPTQMLHFLAGSDAGDGGEQQVSDTEGQADVGSVSEENGSR